jgi:hypothetical protein
VLWSELPPARREIELATLGITVDDLAADAQDVPELRSVIELLSSNESRLQLALRWFGDESHPQPVERTDWYGTGRTPDWGSLPRLEDDEAERTPAGDEADLVGGNP